jgi:DNA polymerase-1
MRRTLKTCFRKLRMNEAACVAFLPDRFDQRVITLAISFPDGTGREITISELSATALPLVTHNASLLVQLLRQAGLPPPALLIDILEALKIASQISRDQGGERHWSVWRRASAFFPNHSDGKRIAALFEARKVPPPPEELRLLVQTGASALRMLWLEVCSEMQERGEFERFLKVEIPVQQIFHVRESRGIAVDQDLLPRLVRASENERFSLFRKICAVLGYSPLGMTDARLASVLLEEEGADAFDNYPVEDWLNVASFKSQSAAVLAAYLKAKRDVSVLRELQTAGPRVYCSFAVHGSVTSRIWAVEPRLQNLRKQFRQVLRADTGRELTYLDYAQFEPGILAALAGDAALQLAYEQSDMYEALAARLFDGGQGRDVAKRIFLAYLYGMTVDRIASLLDGADNLGTIRGSGAEVVRHFFDRFPLVESFRRECQNQLFEQDFVASAFGNKRRRVDSGPLTKKEARWSMNHRVQASASVIFKTALIRIAERFGAACVLLPMHDAALLQFSPTDINRAVFEAECVSLMQSAFTSFFPNVHPKVVAQSFAPIAG